MFRFQETEGLKQTRNRVSLHYTLVAGVFVSPLASLGGHVFHVGDYTVRRMNRTDDAEEKTLGCLEKIAVSEASFGLRVLHRLIPLDTVNINVGGGCGLAKSKWVPRDGDTLITRDNFIFYVFGYDHPKDRVIAFLKYIPAERKDFFNVKTLKRVWNKGKQKFVRAEKLYTAGNYRTFLETFRNHFPEYVWHNSFLQKDVISVPLKQIKKVYMPNECLQMLLKKKRKDRLEKTAVKLLSLLSKKSKVPMGDFGLHGSLALNMHTPESDVDFVVHGAKNFRRLEKTVQRLAKKSVLEYVFTKRLDMVRQYRGRYKNMLFVFNAVRKPEEIKTKHGTFKCFPVRHVKFYCEVSNDSEAMFRPAVYDVKGYVPIDKKSVLAEDELPTRVVSMVGYYRNVARSGERVRVSGLLEQVEHAKTKKTSFQAVVGTAQSEDEYIWPL